MVFFESWWSDDEGETLAASVEEAEKKECCDLFSVVILLKDSQTTAGWSDNWVQSLFTGVCLCVCDVLPVCVSVAHACVFNVCVLSRWWLTAHCPKWEEGAVFVISPGCHSHGAFGCCHHQCNYHARVWRSPSSLPASLWRPPMRPSSLVCCQIAREGHPEGFDVIFSLLSLTQQKTHLGETLLHMKRAFYFLSSRSNKPAIPHFIFNWIGVDYSSLRVSV